jgi:Poly(A) polymerase catalytic subunit
MTGISHAHRDKNKGNNRESHVIQMQQMTPKAGKGGRVYGAYNGILSFSSPSALASSGEVVANARLQPQQQQPAHAAYQSRKLIMPYQPEQAKAIEEKIGSIMRDAEAVAKRTVEPTLDRRRQIMAAIKDFIKKHKRKVYGGVAINEFIKAKDAKAAFYDEGTDVPDIDFYSPNPVEDMKGICDQLHALGIPNVEGKEAQHAETFKINANYWSCCDISYVQSAIYNKIPTKEMDDGILYVHPNFMFIDFLRILNDPLMSYFRLDKSFPRFATLHQYYPIEGATRTVDVNAVAARVFGAPEAHNGIKARIVRRVMEEFIPNSSCVVVGLPAYNSIMTLAGALRKEPAVVGTSNATLLEMLSVEFASDVARVYDIVAAVAPDVRYVEFHPFYDFLGHRCHFVVGGDDHVVIRMFDNKHKCVPFMEVPVALPPPLKPPQEGGGGEDAPPTTVNMRVGTFTVVVMFIMIMRFRVRVEDRNLKIDADAVTMYDNMVAELYQTRDAYLKRHEKSVLENTPFKEFVIPCMGEALHALRINQMVQEVRFRRYKMRGGIKYNPAKQQQQPQQQQPDQPQQKVTFGNSSGNVINQERDRLFNPPPPPGSTSTTASKDDGPDNVVATTNDLAQKQ